MQVFYCNFYIYITIRAEKYSVFRTKECPRNHRGQKYSVEQQHCKYYNDYVIILSSLSEKKDNQADEKKIVGLKILKKC